MFQWPIVKAHIIKYQLMPAVLHLLITTIYTSFFLHDKMYSCTLHIGHWWIAYVAIEETLVVFSLYFLSIEML